jgi:hypothetical protein
LGWGVIGVKFEILLALKDAGFDIMEDIGFDNIEYEGDDNIEICFPA